MNVNSGYAMKKGHEIIVKNVYMAQLKPGTISAKYTFYLFSIIKNLLKTN